MADDKKVYVLDDGKNQYEAMTKEQVITAIENMAATGSPGDIDAGFISKILESNKQGKLKFWIGTMAEYNAIAEKDPDTIYLFSDDPTVDDIEAAITEVEKTEELNNKSIAKMDLDISYAKNAIANVESDVAEINKRLDELGFKEGVAVLRSTGSTTVTPTEITNRIWKQDKVAVMELRFTYPAEIWKDYTFSVSLPFEFRPKTGTAPAISVAYGSASGTLSNAVPVEWADGNLAFTFTLTNSGNATYQVDIINVGWMTD